MCDAGARASRLPPATALAAPAMPCTERVMRRLKSHAKKAMASTTSGMATSWRVTALRSSA